MSHLILKEVKVDKKIQVSDKVIEDTKEMIINSNLPVFTSAWLIELVEEQKSKYKEKEHG